MAMQQFISGAGSWALAALMFAGGLGLPIPAPPLLLAAGVLAGAGQLSLAAILSGSIFALLASDVVWYRLGRWQGGRILALLCKMSLEPDSCVQRTGDFFSRNRIFTLLFSKFVPGLKTVAPALAGMLGISMFEFTVYDGAGVILWAGAFIGAGYVFSEQVAHVAGPLAVWGGWLAAAAVAAFVAWLAWKATARWRFVRGLQIARITPEELFALLEKDGKVMVVDLRGPLAFQIDGEKVRGALHMDPAELERRHGEIPRDRDVVLYCSCPNEASAARMALLLRERGVARVRPLLGGIEAWRRRGYPTEPLAAA